MATTDKEVQAPQQTQQVQQPPEQAGQPTQQPTDKTFIEAGAYKPDIYASVPSEQSNVQFVVRKPRTVTYDPMRGVWSGLVTLVALSLMVGLLFLGIGFSMGHNSSSSTASSGSSNSDMSSGSGAASDTQNANVPNATQSYGNQILLFSTNIEYLTKTWYAFSTAHCLCSVPYSSTQTSLRCPISDSAYRTHC